MTGARARGAEGGSLAGPAGQAADARTVVARVRTTLRERGLIPARARVLVACSGGPDSAALLFALCRLAPEWQLSLEVASVDHGLRPGAAQDVALARAQAERAGVAFHALKVEVARGQGSLQAAARAARYEALLALAGRIGAERIAVGHTQDDQAETVLHRVLRGAGLAGLAAVSPLRADGVIRPLIDCRRLDVHAFAAAHAGPIARDPSNEDRAFTRTRLRAELIPLAIREDPQALVHLAALADDAREALLALEPAVRSRLAMIGASCRPHPDGEPGGMFDLSCLLNEPRALRRLTLKAWLTENIRVGTGALTRAHIDSVERALTRGGEVWLPRGWTALSTGGGRLAVTLDVTRLNP